MSEPTVDPALSTALSTTSSNSDNSISVFDPETARRFELIRVLLADSAKRRRISKTPKTLRKKREIGEGKTAQYVDRAGYQKWLDENFPGWSILNERYWETIVTVTRDTGESITQPILFHVSCTLAIIEAAGVKRTVPCIGTASVSKKELGRDNAHLLKFKYTAALTDAIKTGCNWLGAFFDLRVDEEARDLASQPPTESQILRFNELHSQIPATHQKVVLEMWSKQNFSSADSFLNGLEKKLVEAKQKTVTQP